MSAVTGSSDSLFSLFSLTHPTAPLPLSLFRAAQHVLMLKSALPG